jgi:hypothetical protein
MTAPVLDRRALNRATLSRQLLLSRSSMAPADAVRQLVGLQAQTPQSWYLSLWSRLAPSVDVAAIGRRYLAAFGPASVADRTRFGPDPDRKAIAYQQVGPLPGALLVDGFVAGRWHIERDATSGTLDVLLLRPPSAEEGVAIHREGSAVLAFLEPDAAARRVELALPTSD